MQLRACSCWPFLGALLLLSSAASAEDLLFQTSAEKIGTFAGGGSNSYGQANAVAGSSGNIDDANEYFNAYLRFDLSSYAGGATRARLRVQATALYSPQGSEPFSIFSFEGDPADLDISTSGTSSTLGQQIFQDLQDGTVYGSGVVRSAGQVLEITLDAAGLAAVNAAAGGKLVLGLHATDVSRQVNDPFSEFIRFGNFEDLNGTHELLLDVVSVPASGRAGYVLLALALAVVAGLRLRAWSTTLAR